MQGVLIQILLPVATIISHPLPLPPPGPLYQQTLIISTVTTIGPEDALNHLLWCVSSKQEAHQSGGEEADPGVRVHKQLVYSSYMVTILQKEKKKKKYIRNFFLNPLGKWFPSNSILNVLSFSSYAYIDKNIYLLN